MELREQPAGQMKAVVFNPVSVADLEEILDYIVNLSRLHSGHQWSTLVLMSS
jgi:hypothetical protein